MVRWIILLQSSLGIAAGSLTITVGFMLESLFLEKWPWWGWGIASIPSIVVMAWVVWMQLRLTQPRQEPSEGDTPTTVDYGQARLIINGYIDPDQAMRDGVRLSVSVDILAMFEEVVGAKLGEWYNGELLHRWLQKNAARFLVENRGKMR